MTTINYQPTGVYQQIAKNPALLANGQNVNIKDTGQNTNNTQKKPRAPLSTAGKISLAAGVAGVLLCAGALISNYKKGVRAICKGKDFIEKIQEKFTGKDFCEKYNTFLKTNTFDAKTKAECDKIIADYNLYNNNLVGKIHRVFGAVREFIQDTFYGY